MPAQEILILAVTRMQAGVCLAGMTQEPDPVTGLRWVRPVREYGHVLLGDITTPEGAVLRPFDVVEFSLLRPHPDPPHAEDWIADFRQRPRIARRLEGERRTNSCTNTWIGRQTRCCTARSARCACSSPIGSRAPFAWTATPPVSTPGCRSDWARGSTGAPFPRAAWQ